MSSKKNIIIFLTLFFFDRLTKYWTYHYLDQGFNCTSFLSFNLAFNRGVAWGILNVPNEGIFWSVSIFVILLYCAFGIFSHMNLNTAAEQLGATLILTGGISNIIDRFVYQGVIDFIIISVGSWSWPAFNVADASIVCGVLCIGYVWSVE